MIAEMTIHDALYVCRNMAPLERREREALLGDFDVEAHAVDLWRSAGIKYTCFDAVSGRAVVIGGVNESFSGVGQTWMCSTQEWAIAVREVTRYSRRVFKSLLETELHRIETLSAAFKTDAHRWFKLLRLEYESTARRLGRNGEDFYRFARLREET